MINSSQIPPGQKRNYDQFQLEIVSAQDLSAKFRSKKDIYSYMTQQLQFYLPPMHTINKDFIKQVLRGKKKLLRMNDVKPINVPNYDEVSVKNMFDEVYQDATLIDYFPDHKPTSKLPDRQYFFTILNSVYPQYLKQIIDGAKESRYGLSAEENKQEAIVMTQEWKKWQNHYAAQRLLKSIQGLQRKEEKRSCFFSEEIQGNRWQTHECDQHKLT